MAPPAKGGGGDRRRPRRSRGTLREAAAGRSCLGRGERRDLPLITIRGTFAPVASDRHHGLMRTRQLPLLASGHQGAGVDRPKSMSPEVPDDPPEARQRGGANGGVLTGSPAENPVMPMTVKISSEDTLSVSELITGIPEGSRDLPLIPETHCPAVGFLLFGRPMASRQNPGKQRIVVV